MGKIKQLQIAKLEWHQTLRENLPIDEVKLLAPNDTDLDWWTYATEDNIIISTQGSEPNSPVFVEHALGDSERYECPADDFGYVLLAIRLTRIRHQQNQEFCGYCVTDNANENKENK